MGNQASKLREGNVASRLRALTKPSGREDLNRSLSTIIELQDRLEALGDKPDNLRNDLREYNEPLVNDCRNEVKRLQELKFRRGVSEKPRRKLENEAKRIYGSAVLPLIGDLFRQLQYNQQLRNEVEFDRAQYADDSLQRDLQLVKLTAERFASLERSLGSEVKEIKQANSLLAGVEADLSKQIKDLGVSPEIGSIGSLRFAQRGTTRSGDSQSDVSLTHPKPAAVRARDLREVFSIGIGPSSGIAPSGPSSGIRG